MITEALKGKIEAYSVDVYENSSIELDDIKRIATKGAELALETCTLRDEQIRWMVKFFKCLSFFEEGDPDLPILFVLADAYESVYDEHRGKKSFSEAAMLAREAIIRHILAIEPALPSPPNTTP